MNENLFQIKKNLKNSSNNNKYIYIDQRTKFIYEDSSFKKVLGMNNLLRNKIVEIVQEKTVNDKRIVQIKIENEIIGWIEVTNEVILRLYRLPKTNGKISIDEGNEYLFNTKDYRDEIIRLKDRIIKAYYLFYFNDKRYLIVGTIDGKIIVPIDLNAFKKLIFPDDEVTIYLSKGTNLYSSSNFNHKVSEIKKDDLYNVISYINEQQEVRIERGDKRYWIKHEEFFKQSQTFPHDLQTLELVDFITQLFESNKYNEERVKIMDNKLKKIKNNIVYNNIDEEIYFKNRLGDAYDN